MKVEIVFEIGHDPDLDLFEDTQFRAWQTAGDVADRLLHSGPGEYPVFDRAGNRIGRLVVS